MKSNKKNKDKSIYDGFSNISIQLRELKLDQTIIHERIENIIEQAENKKSKSQLYFKISIYYLLIEDYDKFEEYKNKAEAAGLADQLLKIFSL